MTREEAIKIIERVDICANAAETARDMAIAALQEPEVVHGEWSTIEDDYVGLVALQCSKCNEEYWFEEEPPTKSYNYCPYCGAKMDGDG